MVYEDLDDDYIEHDLNSRYTVSNNSIAFTGLLRSDTLHYVYRDFGSSYFGDFTITFEGTITSAANLSLCVIAMLSNQLGDLNDHYLSQGGTNDYISVYFWKNNVTPGTYQLHLAVAENDYDYYTGISLGTTYYFTLVRSGTTVTLYIYDNAAKGGGDLVDTLTNVCTTTSYKYFYAINSYGSTTTPSMTGTCGNYTLPVVTIEVTSYNDGNGLRIYYSGNIYPSTYIECWCKRWDESNYDITIETFLHSASRDKLFANIVPGSIREYSTPLGWVINLDGTFHHSSNTLILEPQYGYGLSGLRSRQIVLVKSASDTFINPNYFNVKLELKKKRSWSDYV
jgi:hypothetical protein